MQESTAFDEMFEESEARGELRVLFRLLGLKRFGPPDADTESELKAIKDLDRLERIGEEILTARSWKDLLATP